ncbi:hypothetical protein ACT3TB_19300 [Micrococcaceae sp. AOP34-BR2-30]
MKNQLVKAGILIAVVGLIVAAVALAIQSRAESPKDTALAFTVSPHEVEVSIDEEDYGTVATGDTLVVPLRSEVDIEVAREGFVTYTATMSVEPGVRHSIEVDLRPETSQADELLREEQQLSNEQTATERYLNEAEEAYENYPILNDLPQHGELYSAYQGLAEASGHEFGIHLYLYEGFEDQGREEFDDWLSREGYDSTGYDIIEQIENEAPPLSLPEEPTWAELEETVREDVEIPRDLTVDGVDHGELAIRFAETSTTWDTAEDGHHTEGLLRARPLMTKTLAETIEMPHRATTTPTWREAATLESRSLSWVSYYEADEIDEGTQVTLDVCWAWISDEDHAIVDGPRALDLTVVDTPEGPRVENFSYQDPDPFVDNSNSSCRPDDAPQ